MFDSVEPSQTLNFGPCSDEIGGTYQPEMCITFNITLQENKFLPACIKFGSSRWFFKHLRKPQGIELGI